MTVPLLTWRHASALGSMSATTVAQMLAAMNDLFVSELALFPSTVMWQVGDYSVGNGTLTLKPSANNTGETERRIILFGGSSPNTAAIGAATAATTTLYIGYAPTANVDAPQQAYTAGVPYTTGLYLAGGSICSAATFNTAERVDYYENAAGVIFIIRKTLITSASGNIATGIAGEHGVSLDGTTEEFPLCCGSTGAWNASQDSTGSSSATVYLPGAAPSASTTRLQYVEDGVVRFAHRMDIVSGEPELNSARLADGTRYILPIRLLNDSQTRMRFKMRQIGMGINEVYAQTMSTIAGVMAHKLGGRSDTATTGPWLTNYKI